MKHNELTPEEKKIQKELNKLISEEMVAYMLYNACINAACNCQSAIIQKLFTEIANDEKDDHYKHLVAYARENEYKVPVKPKDFDKYANEVYTQWQKLNDLEKAQYYVEQGIKSEQDAIASYEASMLVKEIPYDLNAILLQNYYDEIDHLEKLMTLKSALEAGAFLANI